jgi:hypothetical protein
MFKFDVYAVIYFGSIMAMHLRPLLLGCCKNDDFDGLWCAYLLIVKCS